MTDRRSVLAALAALGTASLASAPRVFGQPRSVKLDVRGGAIDVHHHFVPPGGTTNRPWSPQLSLERMDRFGIGVAILSMTQNAAVVRFNTNPYDQHSLRARSQSV